MSEHSTTEADRPCGSVVNCPFKDSDSNQHRRHLCLQFYMQFSTFEKIKAEEMNKCVLVSTHRCCSDDPEILAPADQKQFQEVWRGSIKVSLLFQSEFVAVTLILNRTKHILLIIKGLVSNTENLRQGSLFVLNPAHFVTMEWNYITTKRWKIFLTLCRENKT